MSIDGGKTINKLLEQANFFGNFEIGHTCHYLLLSDCGTHVVLGVNFASAIWVVNNAKKSEKTTKLKGTTQIPKSRQFVVIFWTFLYKKAKDVRSSKLLEKTHEKPGGAQPIFYWGAQ